MHVTDPEILSRLQSCCDANIDENEWESYVTAGYKKLNFHLVLCFCSLNMYMLLYS
jgi:hypothetical protein